MLPASSSSLLLILFPMPPSAHHNRIFSYFFHVHIFCCLFFSPFCRSIVVNILTFKWGFMSVIMSNWIFYLHFFFAIISYCNARNFYLCWNEEQWEIKSNFEIDILSLIFELDRIDLKIPELVCKISALKRTLTLFELDYPQSEFLCAGENGTI